MSGTSPVSAPSETPPLGWFRWESCVHTRHSGSRFELGLLGNAVVVALRSIPGHVDTSFLLRFLDGFLSPRTGYDVIRRLTRTAEEIIESSKTGGWLHREEEHFVVIGNVQKGTILASPSSMISVKAFDRWLISRTGYPDPGKREQMLLGLFEDRSAEWRVRLKSCRHGFP